MTAISRARWAEQHYPDPTELPSDSGGPINVLVFQPGGTEVPPQQFTGWAALYAAFLRTTGPVTIAIDVTFAPSMIATTDSGVWDMQGRATLVPVGLNTAGGAQLAIPNGSVLQNLTAMTGSIQINSASSVVPPLAFTGMPLAEFDVTEGAAFLQTGAAPVMRVPSGQTFFLTMDGNTFFNNHSGPGALVDLEAGGLLAFVCLSGLFIFTQNLFSGAPGSTIASLYDASFPNPSNPNFHGTVSPPTVIDQAPFVGYSPVPVSNWVAPPPSSASQALDRMATLVKILNGGSPIP